MACELDNVDNFHDRVSGIPAVGFCSLQGKML